MKNTPLILPALAAAFLSLPSCVQESVTEGPSVPAVDSGGPVPSPSVMSQKPAPLSPEAGESIRVGGDMIAVVSGADGNFSAGPCSIDTPLPAGYPAPTPPGAIEIKTYPSVRRAVVSGRGSPDAGMNSAFWPLFNHIKGHDIAMTSPVEMDYTGLQPGERALPSEWSMAFLYRTPELNQTGEEGKVSVRDADPVTVLAIGMKGDYSMALVRRGMEQLESWLATHPEWKADGNWRSLYYNGPALFWWNKWAEVQIPIARK